MNVLRLLRVFADLKRNLSPKKEMILLTVTV